MKLYRAMPLYAFLVLALFCYAQNTDQDQQVNGTSYTQMPVHTQNNTENGIPPVKRGDLDKHQTSPKTQEDRMAHKRRLAQQLIHDAVEFFNNNTIEASCRAFFEEEAWQYEEMFVYVIHESGMIYAHGQDNNLIWRDINEVKKERQKITPTRIREDLIEKMRQAVKGDGWFDYEWNFEYKHAYTQKVEKDGRIYFLVTGFYPESHRYLAARLVESAVDYALEYGAEQAFQRINNPIGTFVQGPIYLWAYNFDGKSFAHGNNIGRVGRDHMDWQGAQGRYLIQDIIEKLQDKESIWIDYYETGEVLKRAYVKRFTDKKGVKYFIGAGYYPEIDLPMVKDFVRSAVNYLKSQGPKIAFRDFTSYSGGFRKGPLRVYVYDMEGTILADGQNPELIGQNMLEAAGEGGKSVAQEILRKAREHGEGRTTRLHRGEYQELYYQKVETPDGTYIVGSGYWPDSKQAVAESLAQKAATHLEQTTIDEAFRDFTTWSSDFVRGDLFIEVLDYDGIIVVYGPRNPYIWSRLDIKTDRGYTIAQVLIETARTAGRGGGWVTYRAQGRTYHMYVVEVAKEIETQDGPQLKRYLIGVYYI